ncbi:uncharacterized protein LOC111639757 [Centruroides sculpturatus]|uniref:uncharacterized protein LOC111639757 n=1 Tax=Centruroides sculpturatus TaxID=218467 RepID=UPI000C6CEA90|nr:uncharacterized protein LOC111639757 [Centruroides sculpturatus]
MEVRGNEAIEQLVRWGELHKLSFSPEKSEALTVARSGVLARRPIYRIRGNPIRRVNELKYLGVIIDQTLCWTPHLRDVRVRTNRMIAALSRLARQDYGLSGEALRTIYKMCVERIVCYACGVWWKDTANVCQSRTLLTIQRPAALRITRAYRTVSTDAALVLAGLLPLPLVVSQEAAFYRTTVEGREAMHCNQKYPIRLRRQTDVLKIHPALRIGLDWEVGEPTGTGVEIYTDGSKDGSLVGAAYCVFSDGVEVYSRTVRLNEEASVFQAELVALEGASQWILLHPGPEPVTVYSDSQSSLQALSDGYHRDPLVHEIRGRVLRARHERHVVLRWVRGHTGVLGNERADQLAKAGASGPFVTRTVDPSTTYIKGTLLQRSMISWRERWTLSTVGRSTYAFVPVVGLTPISCCSLSTQILTGHGRFPHFKSKFGQGDGSCPCGSPRGDARHYVLDCPLTRDFRLGADQVDWSKPPEQVLRTLAASKGNLKKLKELMGEIIDLIDL